MCAFSAYGDSAIHLTRSRARKDMVPAFLVVGILFLLSILTQSYAAPATAISAPSTALEPTTTKTERVTPTRIQYRVVATYPHDSSYFTEGLEFVSPDTIMESTGLVGQSVLVKYNPTEKETSVMSMAEMGLFGEGATLFADKVWWWSWQTELGYT